MNIDFRIGWIFGNGSMSHDFFCKEWKLAKNKYLELQIAWFGHKFDLLGLKLSHYPKSDHTPYNFEFCIFNVEFIVTLYDSRHWNEEENRYYFPGEEEAEWKAEKNERKD